ncbi:MAG: hypothetical protein PHS44_05995 [Candidatus Dojkabacteria bacterium]|nr:hypothetical protein [Candidatus Dojkabacteria bacterium]
MEKAEYSYRQPTHQRISEILLAFQPGTKTVVINSPGGNEIIQNPQRLLATTLDRLLESQQGHIVIEFRGEDIVITTFTHGFNLGRMSLPQETDEVAIYSIVIAPPEEEIRKKLEAVDFKQAYDLDEDDARYLHDLVYLILNYLECPTLVDTAGSRHSDRRKYERSLVAIHYRKLPNLRDFLEFTRLSGNRIMQVIEAVPRILEILEPSKKQKYLILKMITGRNIPPALNFHPTSRGLAQEHIALFRFLDLQVNVTDPSGEPAVVYKSRYNYMSLQDKLALAGRVEAYAQEALDFLLIAYPRIRKITES